MGFIKRTSFLAFFALGAVAYTSDPLPEPSQVPLITAVPVPGIADGPTVNDIPSFTDGPVFTDAPLFTDEPTISDAPVFIDEPTITEGPTITDEPTFTDEPTTTEGPIITDGPAVSPIPSTPTTTAHPEPSPVHPGCGKRCATHSSGPAPSPALKDVCFEKKQTCCYKHSVCATKTKDVQFCKAVKAKKCEKKCAKKCAKVPKTIMKKKCKKQTVYEARKGCTIKWFGMCKPVAVEKDVCCDHAITTYEEVCKNICKPDCKTVTVYQIITKTFKYETFCAKLSCDSIKIAGKAVKPTPYTSKTLVHKANGKVVDHKPAGIVQIN